MDLFPFADDKINVMKFATSAAPWQAPLRALAKRLGLKSGQYEVRVLRRHWHYDTEVTLTIGDVTVSILERDSQGYGHYDDLKIGWGTPIVVGQDRAAVIRKGKAGQNLWTNLSSLLEGKDDAKILSLIGDVAALPTTAPKGSR